MVLRSEREEALAQTLAAIAQFTDTNGYPPTYRDLGALLGIAHSAVFYRVRALARGGLVHEAPNIARGLRVTPAGRTALSGPVDEFAATVAAISHG